MTRKPREAGILLQIVSGSGRRPAIYGFEPLITIIRAESEEWQARGMNCLAA